MCGTKFLLTLVCTLLILLLVYVSNYPESEVLATRVLASFGKFAAKKQDALHTTMTSLHQVKLIAALSALLPSARTVNYVLASAMIVFVMEHLGKKFQLPYLRISHYLRGLYGVLHPVFAWFGTLYAEVMSYLHLIDIGDVYDTFRQLVRPIARLLTLPNVSWSAMVARARRIASVKIVISGSVVALGHVLANVLFPSYRVTIVVSALLVCTLAVLRWVYSRRQQQVPPRQVENE